MPSFDANSFLTKQAGTASGAPEATLRNLGTSFGVPNCLFDLMQNPILASLMPTTVLVPMRVAMEEAEAKTNAVISKIARWIKINLGINLFPDRNGNFGFFSNTNKWGLELGGAEFLSAVGSLMGAVNAGVNAAAQIYQNYQATVGQLRDIQACVGALELFLSSSQNEGSMKRNLTEEGAYQAAIQGENAFAQAQLAEAQTKQAKALECIKVIDAILAERELNPDLEPRVLDLEVTPTESVFRLQAGPPMALNGEFILSVDGLYYDTSEGLEPALLELSNKEEQIKRETHWSLNFDPNLGGRGNELSSENIRYYFNSILDPKNIDDSKALQKFYSQDDVLLSIQGQKNRKVFDVSSDIVDMTNAGQAQVLIDNMKQNLISEVAFFTAKENKRKKQIELAVKVPVLYGKGPIYTPGNVPVNDFSFMEGTNFILDIEGQRTLVIEQDDVEGVVLPLEVKYTQKIDSTDPVVVEHLLLAGLSKGAIIDHDAPSSTAPRLPVTQTIVESDLISLYNVLTVKETEPRGSAGIEYGLHNSSNLGKDYNAQIVGDASSLLKNGLGTAFLEGVSSNSYIRLPPQGPIQDLVYSKKGSTFESWIQLSGLTTDSFYNDSGTSGLYRVILANENTGIASGVDPQDNLEIMSLDEGTAFVRGMVMGFTRDCRFTSSIAASNDNEDNPATDAVFLIAPTQSYDSSTVGFINKEPCNADNTNWFGLTIPVSSVTNGVSFSDCGSEFSHLVVTFNPEEDKVSVYLDSKLVAASGYYDTFGTGKRQTPKIPSLALSSSFTYSGTLKGPPLDKFFTPWIIGGGYTDGLTNGFTGSVFGGHTSGLKGKLGGIKLYSKPLSTSDILENYNANKNFFKFVKLI